MELGVFNGLRPFILHLILLFSLTETWFPPVVYCVSNISGNGTDRVALLEFKAMISSDPYGILSSWNDSADFCGWKGVTCGRKHQRVTSLDLPELSLMGTLSPYISNLTFLRFLNLADNVFHGEIPQHLGYLFRLRYLNLTVNAFEGQIPANISYCSNLTIMDLSRNNLTGKIPVELGSLKKLVTLNLGNNILTGEIPHSFANLTSLQEFLLDYNNLQGNIPKELGQLTRLTIFQVSVNNLIGTIPSTLYNLSSLTQFFVTINGLIGSLPPNIGLTLPNLQDFGIGENKIHGSIPVSFANASHLRALEISSNKLTGPVPNNLGYLKSLSWLNMQSNLLGNNSSRDLDFITSLSNCSNLESLSIAANNFGGPLPGSIANISSLQTLNVAANLIYGKIPTEVGDLVNLYKLNMQKNLFSGPIPDALGKLAELQMLALSINKLSGEIPQSLCNLTQLFGLYLSENHLAGELIACTGKWKNLQHWYVSANNIHGKIPPQITDLFSLVFLNLSHNALTGLIPSEISGLKNINAIDMSENQLSGQIPETIGECLNLEYLNMRGNMLQADIPSSLASLKGLRQLDLSRNNLSGNIPSELEKLVFLKYLNLSFNNVYGEVPKKGVFSNVSSFSIDGNSDVCGGIPELKLPPCPIKAEKPERSTKAIILGAIISPIVAFFAITSCYVFHQQKSRKNPSSEHFDMKNLPRISYKELLQATNGFSLDNIIGEGSFGFVYRANLDPQRERLVAVKVLKLQLHGASKSFLTECKALRNIRHRNLVKILTYCSSIDFKGNDFKALVFDFMVNGSLEMWLHPEENGSSQSRNLSLLQRLRVAIDVSSALHYLHDDSETPIVHCDLKPSNILFDNDMTAHVGDFGLSRLLPNPIDNSSQGETSTIGIEGTIGYMAPEYGVGSQATKHGDVYSFGIVLLEIFTGRRPTDQVFRDGLNLHNFVKANLPGRILQVLDPVLVGTGDLATAATATTLEVMEEDGRDEIQEDDGIVENLGQEGGEALKCIVSVLKIGLKCSAEAPADRMHMGDVNRKLNVIKDAFMGNRTRRSRQTITH